MRTGLAEAQTLQDGAAGPARPDGAGEVEGSAGAGQFDPAARESVP
jgi:hypothetical protein